MERVRKSLILVLIAGIPAASPAVFSAAPAAPELCFTAGSVTYQVASMAPDVRVRIDPVHPDLRIHLVDSVEAADFALVDDVGATTGSTCKAAGLLKTVRLVDDGSPADLTIGLSREGTDGDLKLYVHSGRFGHRDAAALFAAMRRDQLADNRGR
jgi:hypothetical protein